MRAVFAFLAAVLLHEGGHLAAAGLLGISLRRAGVGPLGVGMRFDFSRAGYLREAAVHAAGPAAGFLAAAAGRRLFGAASFASVSTLLSLVNLLPVDGLDGGGILRCVLSLASGPVGERADRVSRAASWTVRIAFWLLAAQSALRGGNLSALLFAVGMTLR